MTRGPSRRLAKILTACAIYTDFIMDAISTRRDLRTTKNIHLIAFFFGLHIYIVERICFIRQYKC